MSKRIISLFLAVLLLMSCSAFTVSATDESRVASTNPPMRFSYINDTLTGLRISTSGVASCVADLSGYSGTTTRIDIEMTLQKRTLLLFWTDEQTWTQTFYNYYGTLAQTKSVSSGTYRVVANYTAYSGTKTEKTTGNSGNVAY